MCGFVGYFSPQKFPDDLIRKMGDSIIHRGPDASGYWSDKDNGLYLCHRRLSVIDITEAGAQPMESYTGRYTITFNGEIYNYLHIKNELEDNGYGYEWRGHSDTEIILRAFEVWGIEPTLNKMIGMFAIALWDKESKSLYLCRDRLGEKPLYYGWQGNSFFFGSELKSFLPHPHFNKTINPLAVSSFFKYNYVPNDLCIYLGIQKLIPGSFASIHFESKAIKIEKYWDLKKIVTNKSERPIKTVNEWTADLDFLLRDAIKQQMLSDVPLGAFLSGGIDSSLIVSIMQAQSNLAIKTFSIGFSDKELNEAIYANAVAKHLGTDHTELYVSSQDALNVIPDLAKIYDEPFSDSSQIPTYLLAKLAREKVTVSLSGDAGDELFCGYERYTQANSIWKKLQYAPLNVRNKLGQLISAKSVDKWDDWFNRHKSFIPSKYHLTHFGDKVHKGAKLLGISNEFSFYDSFLTHSWPGFITSKDVQAEMYNFNDLGKLSFTERMMFLDTVTYLPNDILVKVDRAAMANSLETRVPFLDHRVVEFAWKVPMDLKIRDGKAKWLLRQVLNQYVPKEMIERPKMGFGVPLDSWLSNPLKEWGQQLLSNESLNQHGLLNNENVHSLWNQHIKGERKWHYQLWDILMFQAWYQEYF